MLLILRAGRREAVEGAFWFKRVIEVQQPNEPFVACQGDLDGSPFPVLDSFRAFVGFPHGPRRRLQGKPEMKGRSFPDPASDLYVTTLSLDYPVSYAQTEASALSNLFGGEKGVEDPAQMFLSYALARIGYLHMNVGGSSLDPGPDPENPLSVHGIYCIDYEVCENLPQLVRVARDGG